VERVLRMAKGMMDVVQHITAPNGERLRIRIVSQLFEPFLFSLSHSVVVQIMHYRLQVLRLAKQSVSCNAYAALKTDWDGKQVCNFEQTLQITRCAHFARGWV